MTVIVLVDDAGTARAAASTLEALAKSLGGGEGYDLLAKAEPAAQPQGEEQAPPPHFAAHHADLSQSLKGDEAEDEDYTKAAALMRAGDTDGLKALLRSLDPEKRDRVLDHIHPEHWEGLGFRPVDKDGAQAAFDKKFPPNGADAPEKVKSGAGKSKPTDDGAEKPMAKALLIFRKEK